MCPGRRKENDITRLDPVGSARDNRLVKPLDGNDVIELLLVHQVGQQTIDQPGIITHLDPDQDQGTSKQFGILASPRMTDCRNDLFSRQHLRIDHGVDSQILEKLPVLWQEILIIVDPRQRTMRSKIMSQQASGNVGSLLGRDAHEKIRLANTRLLQRTQRGWIANHRQHLHARMGKIQTFLIRIHQNNILILLRQQFRQVCPDLSGPGYHYFHKFLLYLNSYSSFPNSRRNT